MVTTFLICSDIRRSMRYLTNMHLGKQRVEGCQIVNALLYGGGWQNHPATVMWRGYVYALMYYVNCAIQEWIGRGCKNTIPYYVLPDEIVFPWWVTWVKLHRSHRSLPRRKNPSHYNFPFDDEFRFLGYIWPTDEMYYRQEEHVSLLAFTLTERLMYPRYCTAILKSGPRKKKPCGKLLQLHNYVYCSIHT
jgi:hypothetical protein